MEADKKKAEHPLIYGEKDNINCGGHAGESKKISCHVLYHLHQAKITVFPVGNHRTVLVQAGKAAQVPSPPLPVKSG